MHVATVESTTLATVAFDEARELLRLEFCSRAVYLYFGVPAAVHPIPDNSRTKAASRMNFLNIVVSHVNLDQVQNRSFQFHR